MSRLIGLSLLLPTVLATAGCDKVQRLLDAQNQISDQGQKIELLLQQVEGLKKEVEATKKTQSSLEMKELFREWEKIAYLEPGDAGYSTIRFGLGVLTVQMSDVKPYANGSKVNLKFGNPLASSITGLKAKLDWGRVDDKGLADNGTAKSKEFIFSETLSSGAWTTVPVVLDGIPPPELGFVRVSEVRHVGISLIR